MALTTTVDTSNIPRPCVGMRGVLSAPGCYVQFSGETAAQARERWAREEAHDAEIRAEEARLWQWKIRPWWQS